MKDPLLADYVLKSSRGIPLFLILALRLWRSGGDVRLPDDLPRALIDGYLYSRILDRIIDFDLQALARDGIVLRILTPEILEAVLGDRVPPDSNPADVFGRLSREFTLVEEIEQYDIEQDSSQVLRLRPELRAATLRLLEYLDAEHVASVDRRAANWYLDQDLSRPEARAELVYHLLRLGDQRSAAKYWSKDLAPRLSLAGDEIPPQHAVARSWLADQLREFAAYTAQADWEADALLRIRKAIGRNLIDVVVKVLAERPDRLDSSRLRVYDAWLCWQDGDVQAAQEIAASVNQGGAAARDCAILLARLLRDFDPVGAAKALEGLDLASIWMDWSEPKLAVLAVTSARIRMWSRLEADLALMGEIQQSRSQSEMSEFDKGLRDYAMSSDAILPALADIFDSGNGFFSLQAPLEAPHDNIQRNVFRTNFDKLRAARISAPVPMWLQLSKTDPLQLDSHMAELTNESVGGSIANNTQKGARCGNQLAIRSVRRWLVASEGKYLSDVGILARESKFIGDPLAAAVLGTLGALHGFNVLCTDQRGMDYRTTMQLLDGAVSSGLPLVTPDGSTRRLIGSLLATTDSEVSPSTRRLIDQARQIARERKTSTILSGSVRSALDAAIVYVLSPDPLDVLLRRVLGLPVI